MFDGISYIYKYFVIKRKLMKNVQVIFNFLFYKEIKIFIEVWYKKLKFFYDVLDCCLLGNVFIIGVERRYVCLVQDQIKSVFEIVLLCKVFLNFFLDRLEDLIMINNDFVLKERKVGLN